MRDILKRYNKELFYTVLIFVVWQFLLIQDALFSKRFHTPISLIGLLILFIWMAQNYYKYAFKGISEYSEVMIKIDLKRRFFSFFVTPTLFYIAVTLYLYGVKSVSLRQILLVVSTMTLFGLLIHIRSSYEKVFTLQRSTRAIFQVIDLIFFYIGVTGFLLLGTTPLVRVIGATLVGLILLIHSLILNKQDSWYSATILILSVMLLFVSGLLFVNFGPIVFPLYMTVVFYMITSLWSIRLLGHLKLSDYLPPILFSLMAFMILLSF